MVLFNPCSKSPFSSCGHCPDIFPLNPKFWALNHTGLRKPQVKGLKSLLHRSQVPASRAFLFHGVGVANRRSASNLFSSCASCHKEVNPYKSCESVRVISSHFAMMQRQNQRSVSNFFSLWVNRESMQVIPFDFVASRWQIESWHRFSSH